MPLNLIERTSNHSYLSAVWRAEIHGQESLTVTSKSTWDIIVIESTSHVCVQLWAPHKQPQDIRVGSEGEVNRFTGLRFTTGVYVTEAIQRTMQGCNMVDLISEDGWFRLGKEKLAIPSYDTAELFTDIARDKGLLLLDKMIEKVLATPTMVLPVRTVQRRFLRRTDMSKTQVNQLYRAQYVASLLHQGHTLAEAAAMAGYTDQAHMTRIFKVLFGITPHNFYKTYVDPTGNV